MGKRQIPLFYRNVLSYLLDAKYSLWTMYQISYDYLEFLTLGLCF